MIDGFQGVRAHAAQLGPKTIAVACAQDDDVLKALKTAHEAGMARGYLVGDAAEITALADEVGLPLEDFEVVDVPDTVEAARAAVTLVSSGKADIVMKGLVDTAIILKAVLNKEKGLRTGNVLSHVAVFDVPTYPKLLFVTDAAMNIAPDLETKRQIIENVLPVTRALGISCPNVGVICAKEKVNPAMPATVDAAALVEMNRSGSLSGCRVGGPFALDNAISREAAEIKGIKDPMAGQVDVLLCPAIEAGNMLYKALNFLAGAESAGVVVGARAPIVLTSRADSDASKFNSIALAVAMASKNERQ